MVDTDRLRLVAVYDSEVTARRAVDSVLGAGASKADVRFNEPLDRVVALQGEMRDEIDHSGAGPGVAPYTKEAARGVAVVGTIGAVVGAIVALPFSAIPFGLPFWGRLLLVEIVGVIFGFTIGWVIGSGFGARRPQESLAAERGVTVTTPVGDNIRRALLSNSPLRLDIYDTTQGTAYRTIATEDDQLGAPGVAREIGKHIASEERDD